MTLSMQLRQAVRDDVAAIQRVRHAVHENRLTSRVIPDDEVIEAIERSRTRLGDRTGWADRRLCDRQRAIR
jgi:hypothetical protein